MSHNETLKPRLCIIVKSENGYGFHLHGEKGKIGQRIRKVEEGSAAEQAGLKGGDRIICVNGTNVERDSHKEVVDRIRENSNETRMLVVDEETDKYLQDQGLSAEQVLTNGTENNLPAPETTKEPSASETKNGSMQTNYDEPKGELRPRLCKLVKGDTGYGFNLHSEKGKPGRFVRTVEDNTPASNAGMKMGDRIIEVNGTNLEYEKHSKVVTAIKDSGTSVELLVVDEETDNFFKQCEVTPTAEYLTGPLPTPKPPKQEVDPTTEMLAMDLTMLMEKSKSSRKKKAPEGDWRKRQALFNNM